MSRRFRRASAWSALLDRVRLSPDRIHRMEADDPDREAAAARYAALLPSALDILVLGPFPPPFGGVSTYVQRLHRLVVRRGFRVGVLNHFSSATDTPERPTSPALSIG